jgi:hypothetical protein
MLRHRIPATAISRLMASRAVTSTPEVSAVEAIQRATPSDALRSMHDLPRPMTTLEANDVSSLNDEIDIWTVVFGPPRKTSM